MRTVRCIPQIATHRHTLLVANNRWLTGVGIGFLEIPSSERNAPSYAAR